MSKSVMLHHRMHDWIEHRKPTHSPHHISGQTNNSPHKNKASCGEGIAEGSGAACIPSGDVLIFPNPPGKQAGGPVKLQTENGNTNKNDKPTRTRKRDSNNANNDNKPTDYENSWSNQKTEAFLLHMIVVAGDSV